MSPNGPSSSIGENQPTTKIQRKSKLLDIAFKARPGFP